MNNGEIPYSPTDLLLFIGLLRCTPPTWLDSNRIYGLELIINKWPNPIAILAQVSIHFCSVSFIRTIYNYFSVFPTLCKHKHILFRMKQFSHVIIFLFNSFYGRTNKPDWICPHKPFTSWHTIVKHKLHSFIETFNKS